MTRDPVHQLNNVWNKSAMENNEILERIKSIAERHRRTMTKADIQEAIERLNATMSKELTDQCRNREFFEVGLTVCAAIRDYCYSLADDKVDLDDEEKMA